MIPEFTPKGYLPEGIHLCTGGKFLDMFLSNPYRKGLQKSISDIFDWAIYKHATKLFVGGSFVTNKAEPDDIDCLIVFYDEASIPHKTELLTIGSTKFDIQFCTEKDIKVLDTFIGLLSLNWQNERIGIIQIDLYNEKSKWEILHEPDEISLEVVKRAYINRHFVDHYTPSGILVTIPGLLSTPKWNAELAPIASSRRWIFAPFIYDDNTPDILIDSARRKKVIDEFRVWMYDLSNRYESPISIIAHSFGTYIIAAYIVGFTEFTPVRLNALILTGSILNSQFDWDLHKGNKIARVRNEIAPNDQWVRYMPNLKWLDKDTLYGNSGVVGFSKKSDILSEYSNNIFDHNNVIKRDVIEQYWFPYLIANRNAHHEEAQKYLSNKFSQQF